MSKSEPILLQQKAARLREMVLAQVPWIDLLSIPERVELLTLLAGSYIVSARDHELIIKLGFDLNMPPPSSEAGFEEWSAWLNEAHDRAVAWIVETHEVNFGPDYSKFDTSSLETMQ